MSRNLRVYTLLIIFCALSQDIMAQYNIKTDGAISNPVRPLIKVAPPKTLNINAFAEEQRKLERRKRMQEDNLLDIKASFAISQSSFTNWAAGGNNSIAGAVAFYLNHVYDKNNVNIHNVIDAAYGLSRIDREMRKQEDRFDYSTTFGWRIHDLWYLSSTVNLKSQFDAGYKYPDDSTVVSKFLAPGYLTLGIGIKYISKNKKLTIELDPLTGRMTFVEDRALASTGSYGVEPGSFVYSELGSKFILNYQTAFWQERFMFRTKFEVFSNYSKSPTFASESWLDFKLAPIFWLKFYVQVFYDKEAKTPNEKSKVQVNQTAGLGIGYNFNNKAVRKLN